MSKEIGGFITKAFSSHTYVLPDNELAFARQLPDTEAGTME